MFCLAGNCRVFTCLYRERAHPEGGRRWYLAGGRGWGGGDIPDTVAVWQRFYSQLEKYHRSRGILWEGGRRILVLKAAYCPPPFPLMLPLHVRTPPPAPLANLG
jgi:hypothetical protein